jgi:hypothetical protein
MASVPDDEWEDQLIEVDPPLLGRSKVLLTAHALEQMGIRGITSRQVLQVIRSPHEFHDADMGRVRAAGFGQVEPAPSTSFTS